MSRVREPQSRRPGSQGAGQPQQRAAMANGGNQAPLSASDHVVIFPFMAKGHTLPLLHFATALSLHHDALRVTLITTPANRAFAHRRLPESVDLVELPFPSLPPLPAGVESTDALPCASMYSTFLHATALLREPFADFLASLPHANFSHVNARARSMELELATSPSASPPLVLVSDFFLGFTHRVAGDAGVCRIVFHGMSCFSMAICTMFQPGATFQVPGMPEHVAITAEEVPESVQEWNDPVTRFILDDIGDSDARSWGVLVNSFAALEEDYVSALESFYYQPGARAWLVGPLFLAGGEDPDGLGLRSSLSGCSSPPPLGRALAKRKGLSSLAQAPAASPQTRLEVVAQQGRTHAGLQAWRPGSVVCVSFGTQAHVTDAQLDEIAWGLADTLSSGPSGPRHGRRRWTWVLMDEWSVLAHKAVGDLGRWKARKLVFLAKGSAVGVQKTLKERLRYIPDVVHAIDFITSAPTSVDDMDTTTAGISSLAGTEANFGVANGAEQPLNARHIVDIIGAGVRVDVTASTATSSIVERAEVDKTVRMLMNADGEVGKRQMARLAVRDGGTSRLVLENLVQELQRTYKGDETCMGRLAANAHASTFAVQLRRLRRHFRPLFPLPLFTITSSVLLQLWRPNPATLPRCGYDFQQPFLDWWTPNPGSRPDP
ncbi:hypothetical protein HU200_023608 [Digitaria exilis]|uniref:Uncharacterized protein n=1 Tax=Digitaria exilis TaxID=1010633 RepID=A0A835C175_9POAL|nr:hypothetical protein HU200_023608 [Digitaria exilis]